MRNRLHAAWSVAALSAAVVVVLTTTAGATTTESGDAGDSLASAQVVSGAETTVTGSLTAVTDAVDIYRITIDDPAAFTASTDGSTLQDTELFLFDSTGRLVEANDDWRAFTEPWQSYLPAAATGNPYSPTAAGTYYLAVVTCCAWPVDGSDQSLDDPAYWTTGASEIYGPLASETRVLDHWVNVTSDADSGSYTVALTGVGPLGATTSVVQQFGSDLYDEASWVATDGAGHVYVVGATEGTLPGQSTAGSYDVFVRQYNTSDGSVGWTRQFGTTETDWSGGIAVGGGYVYVLGYTEKGGALPDQTSAGGIDAFVRQYAASDGTAGWTRQFGTDQTDWPWGAAVDSSGHLDVVGTTEGDLAAVNAGAEDVFVRQYETSDGTVNWTRQFGSTGYDRANGMTVDASGAIYVSGQTNGALPDQTNAGSYDGFLRKYANGGDAVWTSQFGTTGSDQAYGVAVNGSGTYVYVTGKSSGALAGTNAGIDDAFVRQYNTSDGTANWTKQFGTTANDWGTAAAVDSAGNLDVLGWTAGALSGYTNAGDEDMFVRQYNSAGVETWTRQFGTPADDYSYALAVDASRTVYIGGVTGAAFPGYASFGGGYDAFLAKIAPSAAVGTVTAISADPEPSPPDGTVTYTATVAAIGGSLTGGTVTFSEGATTICAGVAVSAGQASCQTSYTTTGTHRVAAAYSGTASFDASWAQLSHMVKVSTTTALAADPEPSTVGQQVTYTATVTPGSGTLNGGTVTFTEEGTPVCTEVTVTAGQATCSRTYSTDGQVGMTAVYSGTATFAGSSSDEFTHTTAKVTTTTDLVASPSPSVIGQTVTYTATITPGSGTLTGGTVTFTEGATTLCPGVAVSGGQATCPQTHTTLATHTVTATYSGTATFATSTSTPVVHEVGYGVTLTSRTTARAGGTLRIKLQLTDSAGTNQSASTITLTVTGIEPAFTPQPTGTFTYVGRGKTHYEYSLDVPSGQAAASYNLLVTVTGDPVTHKVPVTIR